MSLKSLIHWYEIYERWLQDLTLNSSPCRYIRHQLKEKSGHSDSLLDRKRVRRLLRNRFLVLPSMILSFVYLLSISKMKIKTRDKFNSLQSTHIISLITRKIKCPKEWFDKKYSPFLNRSLTLFLSGRESLCTDFPFSWCLVSLQGLELRVKSRNQLLYISYLMNKPF